MPDNLNKEITMQKQKKILILGLALSLLLALMIGGIVARESVQTCKVYTNTSQFMDSFTAQESGTGWSWGIAVHHSPGGFLGVRKDSWSNPYILEVTRTYSDGGNIDIDAGHWYGLSTWQGTENWPGSATCVVANVNWNPDKPGNE
jgi:hypothetical protein